MGNRHISFADSSENKENNKDFYLNMLFGMESFLVYE